MSLVTLGDGNSRYSTPKDIAYSIIIASPILIVLASLVLGKDGGPVWSLNPWSAFLISLSSVFSGTFIVVILIRKSKQHEEVVNEAAKRHTHCKDVYKGSFSDIIRDGNYYASLPRFQFLLWTFVISFTFLSVYLIRIFGGEFGFPTQIPNEVLELMGISVIVPTISTPLSSYKYDTSLAQKPPCKEEITPASDMLLESGKPALFRYQMFLWTLIGIGIYLLLFFSNSSAIMSNVEKAGNCKQLDIQFNSTSSMKNKENIKHQFDSLDCGPLRPFDKGKALKAFSLPSIDPSLVILTGISQGGYLSGKLVARTPIKIERVVRGPDKGNDKALIIFGSNFQTGGNVLIDNNPPTKGISQWTDSMIEVLTAEESQFKNWRIIEVITNESTQARYEREGPFLIYTEPSEGAKDISTNTRVIAAIFSEPLKPETFTKDIFTLKMKNAGMTKIDGTASYEEVSKTATFTLSQTSSLLPSTEYIATINYGITNEQGIPMKESKIWSFSTAGAA